MQKRTLQNRKKGTVGGQTIQRVNRRLSRDHRDYWKQRLRKRPYVDRGGRKQEAAEWSIRMKREGREAWFNLGRSNQEVAAEIARNIWLHLIANGWESTLDKFKPRAAKKQEVTLGEFLKAAQPIPDISPRTFRQYSCALERMAAELKGIDGGKRKFDYRTGGRDRYLEKVHAVKLTAYKKERILSWRNRYLQKAGDDPLAQQSAKRNVNTVIRNCKSLFSHKVLQHLNFELPEPLPFRDIPFLKEGDHRYRSVINPELLLTAAYRELRGEYPEPYKALLLFLYCGLRRAEADCLLWSQVMFDKQCIRIENTRYFKTKTTESCGDIRIETEPMEELRTFMATARGLFVLESPTMPRPNAKYRHYRCQKTFKALIDWMRDKGITARTPLHALRKEAGSLVNASHDIHAASRFLRHADVTTTARHYADNRRGATVGLGSLLKEEPLRIIEGGLGK